MKIPTKFSNKNPRWASNTQSPVPIPLYLPPMTAVVRFRRQFPRTVPVHRCRCSAGSTNWNRSPPRRAWHPARPGWCHSSGCPLLQGAFRPSPRWDAPGSYFLPRKAKVSSLCSVFQPDDLVPGHLVPKEPREPKLLWEVVSRPLVSGLMTRVFARWPTRGKDSHCLKVNSRYYFTPRLMNRLLGNFALKTNS